MAKYKVLEKSFIDGAIREEGDIVEINDPDFKTSPNIELVDEKSDKSKAK